MNVKILPDPEKCTCCSSCTAVCPISTVRPHEYLSPRGKIYYLQLKDRFKPSDALQRTFLRSIFACTSCGRCNEACSSGVDLLKIWNIYKHTAMDQGLIPSLSQIANSIEENGNIYGMDNFDREELLIDALEDDIPQIKDRIYRPGKQANTIFFLGCLENFRSLQLDALRSQLSILETLQIDYLILAGKEYCCGHPLAMMGLDDRIKKMQEHNKALFEEIGASQILTNCPGCLISLRDKYQLSQRVQHMTEFLDEKIDKLKNPLGIKIAYHDPCELRNILKITEPPRSLLRKIGVDIIELEPSCCGAGGLLLAVDSEMSQDITQNKISDQKIEKLVTCCPSCLEQFNQQGIQAIDLNELIHQALIQKEET